MIFLIFVAVIIKNKCDSVAFSLCKLRQQQNSKQRYFVFSRRLKQKKQSRDVYRKTLWVEKKIQITSRLQSIVLGFSDPNLKVCSTFGHIAQISNPKNRATSYVVCLPWSHFQKVLVGRTMLMWFYFLLAPRCHLRLPCSQLCLSQAARHLRRLQMKRNLLADPPQWLNELLKHSYPITFFR